MGSYLTAPVQDFWAGAVLRVAEPELEFVVVGLTGGFLPA